HAVATEAPTLTNPEYETVPPIKELQQMTSAQLQRVRDFTVRRRGVGEIVWEGETDVTGLDLDRIVDIDDRSILVYGGLNLEAQPLPGHGLNRPAVLTLLNVFPV
ncbi:unnamed protein product, partial [Phaeothamnion confervicola]